MSLPRHEVMLAHASIHVRAKAASLLPRSTLGAGVRQHDLRTCGRVHP